MLAGGAALVVFGIATPACGSPPEQPPAVDELESQLTFARHDSELAAAEAGPESPDIATALKQVASERFEHAQTLATEINRVAMASTTTSSQTTSPRSTTDPPAPAPTLFDVLDSLRASAASAGQLATTSAGYRAGLLGAIAAACTAAYSVTLVFEEPAS
jgi:hypothetical protein